MMNWLDDKGRLAFLMPRELANQASYEGWRRLGSSDWHFLAFHDWSNAGHPFDPVKEDFLTFVIGKRSGQADIVPVFHYAKKRRDRTTAGAWANRTEAEQHLEITQMVAGQIIPSSTAFTFAADSEELQEFSLVAGECEYIGREGIEFYPQELLLFKYDGVGPREGTAWLRNLQVARSRYKIPNRRILLETKYLHPLVKGPEIGLFHHDYSGLIVAFPYEEADPLRPIPATRLNKESGLLLQYYRKERETIEKQTKFSDKIRGENPGEFYGLARTGPYSFAETYVAFRDNTKWCATVIEATDMPWGKKQRFVFQNHAVSMCERRNGAFIGNDEAHYVCAILNTPVAQRFIVASSDTRSYKIRPPIYVPLYNPENEIHRTLVAASKKAHSSTEQIEEQRLIMGKAYLELCRRRREREKEGIAAKPLSLFPITSV